MGTYRMSMERRPESRVKMGRHDASRKITHPDNRGRETRENWTIVQHSAYGWQGNPDFAKGLEERKITTAREILLVQSVNGLIVHSYEDAEKFAMQAMYPGGVEGMIPKAMGTFSDKTIDGLRIYIPVRKVVG
jgi:hypothetical protein